MKKCYRGLRRFYAEFGRGLRLPRLGPLFSTIGATEGIPEGSRAPVSRIKSVMIQVTETGFGVTLELEVSPETYFCCFDAVRVTTAKSPKVVACLLCKL
jgi:hypothetical protein